MQRLGQESLTTPVRTVGVMAAPAPFKGNKQALPSKPCSVCGRPMSWRKRWARTWAEVKHCSDACRKAGKASKAKGTGV